MTNYKQVTVTSGPSFSDPSDIGRLTIVFNDGKTATLAMVNGGAYRLRFVVWLVRLYVRKMLASEWS